METFSALLAICAGNSPVPGEFPAQRPVTRSFDIFFDLRLNKRLSKQWWCWWFETTSSPLWRHCNVFVGFSLRCWKAGDLKRHDAYATSVMTDVVVCIISSPHHNRDSCINLYTFINGETHSWAGWIINVNGCSFRHRAIIALCILKTIYEMTNINNFWINGRHFVADIFEYIYLNENVSVLTLNHLQFTQRLGANRTVSHYKNHDISWKHIQ